MAVAYASPPGRQHGVAGGNGDLASRKRFDHPEGLSGTGTKPPDTLDKAPATAVREIGGLVGMAGADEPVELLVGLVPVERDLLDRWVVGALIEARSYGLGAPAAQSRQRVVEP